MSLHTRFNILIGLLLVDMAILHFHAFFHCNHINDVRDTSTTQLRTAARCVYREHAGLLELVSPPGSSGMSVVRGSSLLELNTPSRVSLVRFVDVENEDGMMAIILDRCDPKDLVFMRCRINQRDIISISRNKAVKRILFNKCDFEPEAIQKICLLQSLQLLEILPANDMDVEALRARLKTCLSNVQIEL